MTPVSSESRLVLDCVLVLLPGAADRCKIPSAVVICLCFCQVWLVITCAILNPQRVNCPMLKVGFGVRLKPLIYQLRSLRSQHL